MTTFSLELSPCGGTDHLSDLARFQAQGLPVSHSHSSWPLHNHSAQWLWARALSSDGNLLCGFAIALHSSRAVPGMRLGRIDHFGGTLHQSATPIAGRILAATARAVPRLLRLEVRLFDCDPEARMQLAGRIVAAGGIPLPEPKDYRHTLVMDLEAPSETLLFERLSSRMRRNLRKTSRQGQLSIKPITDPRFAARMRQLHHGSFERHAGSAPTLDVIGMIEDALSCDGSQLLGAFDNERPFPENLIAFAWATHHGDHATYVHAASEPIRNASAIAPGAMLMWQLILWARRQGANWFDLGGALPPDAPENHPLRGIIRFKEGFSHELVELAGEYRFDPHPNLLNTIDTGRRMINRIKMLAHGRLAQS